LPIWFCRSLARSRNDPIWRVARSKKAPVLRLIIGSSNRDQRIENVGSDLHGPARGLERLLEAEQLGSLGLQVDSRLLLERDASRSRDRIERIGGDRVAGDTARNVEQDAVHPLGDRAGFESRAQDREVAGVAA